MNQARTLDRSPQLAARLGALRRALLAAAWLRGLSLVAAAAALWAAWAFLADWGLRVPAWVRWLHLALFVAGLGWAAWRWLVVPLRRQPEVRELALLLERAHGGRGELLLSAVELQAAGGADGADAPALAPRILRAADAEAARMDPRAAMDWRGVLGPALCALLVLLGWVACAWRAPELVERFARRAVGAELAWPARTQLELELSSPDSAARIERRGDEFFALLPRGARLELSVRALGRDPGSVHWVQADGTRRALTRSGPALYRASLLDPRRAAQGASERIEAWVVGGDDQDRLPLIRVEIEEPPEVERIALAVRPPAYTGAAPELLTTGSARVPAGSNVSVHVLASTALTRARLRDEDSGTEHELGPQPFPAQTDRPAGESATAWAVELPLTHSLRYRILLTDARELANPTPGLHTLEAQADRPPRVEWLGPDGGARVVTPQGALRLRAQVSDDWYVVDLAYQCQRRGAGAPAPADGSEAPRVALALAAPGSLPASAPAEGAPGRRMSRANGSALLELSALLPGAELGTQHELVLIARDGAEPLAQQNRSTPLRLTLLKSEELLRDVQGALARPRTQAAALSKRMQERATRYDELLAAHAESNAWEAADLQAAHALLAGVLRSRSDASALFRELAGLAESVVYARVDEASLPLCARLDEAQASSSAAGPVRAAWSSLCEQRRQSGLGDGGAAAPLVDLVGLCLEIEQPHLERAEQVLRAALASADPETLHGALIEAAGAEAAARALLERMQDAISEWDNYQAVIGLTRDILERQRALRERTRGEASRR